MTEHDLVCVVDDDEMVRMSVCMLIETLGVQARSYANCLQLMEDESSLKLAGCLVLDVRMPGISGLEMQERLESLRVDAPIIFISGHGDVPMVVRAMRGGALDFLQKPFDEQLLLDRVEQAIAISAKRRRERVKRATVEARLATLTPREKQVLEGIIAGRQNKVIAENLGISMKTVEQHRARIMEKMHAASLAELVRHVTELGRNE
ncbi:MAG: response regulator [Candidatus Methylophosphatis roskildensis]|uniref:Response regulator transcription factor n=1 Tax=Candidatus Methylophosphatis roskildensis TaxID=2899263 RepID=A0A9D7E5E2_9PROT|nr:response regulator transcription factor [Candidatus Methylophosphatis roskildensis]MBK7234423.1 response regulator transcription factor [Sterolibacteriaceae bacterium]